MMTVDQGKGMQTKYFLCKLSLLKRSWRSWRVCRYYEHVEFNLKVYRKAVTFRENRCYVIKFQRKGDETNSKILYVTFTFVMMLQLHR